MKNIIITLILSLFLISCENKQFTMRVCTGEGLTYTETWVKCDSFQMINQNEAFIWSNGVKMKIIGTRGIRPQSN